MLYSNAKKAILYDPVSKKILDIAPINIGTPSAQASSSAQTAVKYKLALRNGTTTVGLANKIETEIKKANLGVEVLSKDNSSVRTYENTVIVVINNSARSLLKSFESVFKDASVSALPSGEEAPKDADILIILGKDRI